MSSSGARARTLARAPARNHSALPSTLSAMNTPNLPASDATGTQPSTRRWVPGVRWTGWTTVLVLVAGVAFVLWITRASEVVAVRRQLAEELGASWDRQFGVRLGAVPFALARGVAHFLDLPAEARAGMSLVRGVEVSVSQGPRRVSRAMRRDLLACADQVLERRGWDRLVGVIEGDTVVGVYVPESMRSLRRLSVCVVVLDREQLVIASVRGNLQPLMELEPVREALEQVRSHLPAPLLVSAHR